MSKDETAIEKAITDAGLTAPRITPEMLDAEIVAEDYHVFPGSCLTVCCLTLKNGFTVTGESACASPENFDAKIGQRIAYANAREKIWPLMGFRLRDALAARGEGGARAPDMAMFRKKPVTVEARQVPPTGARLCRPRLSVTEELAEWCGGHVHDDAVDGPSILIDTLEGVMKATRGDWIIKGVKGEFYPCKPDIFAATYEEAEG